MTGERTGRISLDVLMERSFERQWKLTLIVSKNGAMAVECSHREVVEANG
jgi:hypothetical protein